MDNSEYNIIAHLREANSNIRRAQWWLKDINRRDAEQLELLDSFCAIYDLLQQAETKIANITYKYPLSTRS